jgi:hypothetical protein
MADVDVDVRCRIVKFLDPAAYTRTCIPRFVVYTYKTEYGVRRSANPVRSQPVA